MTSKQTYKLFCQAIAEKSKKTGKELSEHIAEVNRQTYIFLFNDSNIRKRDMTPEQLLKLETHLNAITRAIKN